MHVRSALFVPAGIAAFERDPAVGIGALDAPAEGLTGGRLTAFRGAAYLMKQQQGHGRGRCGK